MFRTYFQYQKYSPMVVDYVVLLVYYVQDLLLVPKYSPLVVDYVALLDDYVRYHY